MLWIYDGAFAAPDSATPMDDSDTEWQEALAQVDIVSLKKKLLSPAICAGEFKPGTRDKFQASDNLLAAHALVLDVDVWKKEGRPDVEPFTEQDLRDRLDGFRFIAWTTWSSAPDLLKWRVVIPFESPMPASKYVSLWKKVNEALDDVMAEGTKDPARLGFFRTVGSQVGKDHYHWFIAQGERLDWTTFDLEEEEFGFKRALVAADLSRSPDWNTDEGAKEKARRYYRTVGRDVDVGNRHECLLRASCRLWWDWAAPDEQWVFDVLSQINNNFAEPKDESFIWDEVRAGNTRTMGEARVEQPTPYGTEREPEMRASKTGIAEHGKSLVRQAREEDKVKGRALKAIAACEAFADPVEGRKVATDAATEIAQLYSKEQPERLLELMRPSLEAQRDKSTVYPIPTDEEILSRIRWKQKEVRQRMDDRQKVKHDTLKRSITRAFNGTREHGYTAKEIQNLEAFGFAEDHWILQHGKDYYFFVLDDYRGPYSRDTAETFAHIFLAPAHDQIKLHYVTKDGSQKERKLEELMRDYGSFVDFVEKAAYATKGKFLENEKKLLLPIRMRPLEAAYDPQVAEWLKRLAREKIEALLDWLAAVPATERELSALYLVTDKNQGKALLAAGVARIWREAGAVFLHEYSTDLYEESPLVLCDEYLPISWMKKPTAMLRAFLSESSRTVKKPYTSKYTSRGYPRIIFAANNLNLFKSVESFDANDEDAVGDRLLIIDNRGDDSAQRYLNNMGAQHRQFVTADRIAKHVLYLRDTRKLSSTRFVVAGNSKAEVKRLFVTTNDKYKILFDWILNYLAGGNYGSPALVTDEKNKGDLYINSSLLLRAWSGVDPRGISPSTLGQVMKACCLPGRRLRADTNVWYRPIDPELFEAWLSSSADVTLDDIKADLMTFCNKKAVKFCKP